MRCQPRFDDLELESVDAAVVALAETLGVSRIATTDRQHFAPLAAALTLTLVPSSRRLGPEREGPQLLGCSLSELDHRPPRCHPTI